jgi:hypothetical protein
MQIPRNLFTLVALNWEIALKNLTAGFDKAPASGFASVVLVWTLVNMALVAPQLWIRASR